MYLRPGNLYKDFTVEKKDRTVSSRGRAKSGYSDDGVTIRGILAEAKPQEKERWRQLQHPISHTIVQRGKPKADPEDRLIFGDRIFFVQGVDEPGALGLWTIYYVEERFDGYEHQD